jgi:general secretion pathway protein D
MKNFSTVARLVVPGLVLCLPVLGQAQNVKTIADREAARRQARIPHGEEIVARAQSELNAKQYQLAHDDFRTALHYLPSSAASGTYSAALNGFCESGVKLAEQRIAEGKYEEAEQILNEILTDAYNPNCREARTLLTHLHDPGYINKTMGPKFLAKVEEVKRLLTEAEGFYQSGRYDLAMKRYDQVLNLDPYNTAARKGQERIDLTKYQYGVQAYNETRGRAMWQVEHAWEEPVRQYGQPGAIEANVQREASNTARIRNKLDSIIIPRIEFRDASIREAIDFVRQQAAANDPTPEGRRGVDIVLRLHSLGRSSEPAPVTATTTAGEAPLPAGENAPPPAAGVVTAAPAVTPATPSLPPPNPGEARITLTLNQIPLGEALRYIASQAGLKVKVEPYAVLILPLSEQSNELTTKEYRVPPGFISSTVNVGVSALSQGATKVGGGGAPAGTGKDTQESTGGQLLVNREGAREFLESQGVPFPPGASAHFLPQSSRLIVRNTIDNLELVDALVEQANIAGPKQVEIESKFVEITQDNLKELGFDWLLGPFNIAGKSGKIVGAGGAPPAANPANFPFPTTNQFPVTAGNRSGDFAISANALDALLLGTGAPAVAPGIFGLAGVMTNPQFQVVIRALNQKKGIDLLSAPRVTTKSGQRAVIEIVREFRYPTQYTPPQVPNITGGGSGTGTVSISVVTPTTPTAFETRNTGVTLEVEPVVGSDGVTIDLNLVPQVVEFEGFVNYGSPIFGINPSIITNPLVSSQVLLTDNVINQPVFSTRKVTTSVSVYDGSTVVLGGLMREDVQKTEDRTPIIGDIPIVGRLFRTNTDQHVKRNLVIFVTAHLVTPAGTPFNSAEEEEELVQPPQLPEVPMYKK